MMSDKSNSEEGKEQVRDLLRKVAEERALIPDAEKSVTVTPRKYALPIGLNEKGEPVSPTAPDDGGN